MRDSTSSSINIRSAAGGYDLTNQIIKDVESQHE